MDKKTKLLFKIAIVFWGLIIVVINIINIIDIVYGK